MSAVVVASVEELLADASSREPFSHADGKSGVPMELVVIDGQRFVLKRLHHADDWIMRATGDLVPRPILMWRSGLFDRLPSSIDHATVAAAWDIRPEGVGGAILMRDVGEWLLPEGDDEIPLDQHERFLDHMAEMHVSFLGFSDTVGLLPTGTRWTFFGPAIATAERAFGGSNPVPTHYVPTGWERFPDRVEPRVAAAVLGVHADPDPLVRALASTPRTLLAGDWKAGNLGSHPDGRTILLDWAMPGEGPPCGEVGWYLALNRARLPQSKEESLDVYRASLERHGLDTEPWWDRQLALCGLGMLAIIGWEKALGDAEEDRADLAWWEQQALAGLEFLA